MGVTMSFFSWVMTKIYDGSMQKAEERCLREWREELLSPLSGDVLEIGGGTGVNLTYYPKTIRHLTLLEPDTHMRQKLLEKISENNKENIEVLAVTAEAIPASNASYDAVVSTLVLCSVDNPDQVLTEIYRILRPQGKLIFIEHVAANNNSKRLKWQKRLEPFWKRIACGCHLTRTTENSMIRAGFKFDKITHQSMRGVPAIVRPSIKGIASKNVWKKEYNMRIFLETERLVLTYTDYADLESIITLRADPAVMKYIGTGKVQTKEEVEKFLNWAISYQDKQGLGFFSVLEKESQMFIGQAGLFHLGFDEKQEDVEIAYRLHQTFWSKGYATECARALIRWGFDHLPQTKLMGFSHPENTRSCHVLEKVGMVYAKNVIYPGHETLCQGLSVKCYEIHKSDQIELVQYDSTWPYQAELEIEKLYQLLPRQYVVDIQHVGSTAIPGMIAKPLIDIQIAATSLDAVKNIAIQQLEKIGYRFWYDNPDHERLFFAKGMPPYGEKRTHHVHIFEKSCPRTDKKIIFRDYLRSHSDAAKEYAALKITLAQQFKYDREQYTEAKKTFIDTILIKAQSEESS